MNNHFSHIITTLIVGVLAFFFVQPIHAQRDSRNRTTETVVQDVLAQMPTQNSTDFAREMSYLTETAPRSIVILASMMQPAEKHRNAQIEYAISGAVVQASQKEEAAKAVAQGLQEGISKAVDETARQFLQWQLRLLSTQEDVTYTDHEGAPVYAEAYDQLVQLGDKAGDQIVKTLKTKDHALRMQALKYATDHQLATPKLTQKVVKKYGGLSEEGKIDVVNWLGDNKAATQKPFLMKVMKKGDAPGIAAIEALGKIGGEDVVVALLDQLSTDRQKASLNALRSIKDGISQPLLSALAQAQDEEQEALLSLASNRRVAEAAPSILELAQSTDPDVAQKALQSLPGVVTAAQTQEVAKLLDNAPEPLVTQWQRTLQSCISTLTPEEQFNTISSLLDHAAHTDRFYEPLSAVGTDSSVQKLEKIWKDQQDAKAIAAIRKSQNFQATRPLLQSAQQGDAQSLNAFVKLINQKERNLEKREKALQEALKLSQAKGQKQLALNALGDTPTRNAFLLAGEYLTDPDVKYEAAMAEKNIAVKTEEDIEYDIMNKNLSQAIEILQATGDADDGYAVNEIKKILADQKPSPIFELSPEEKAQGYEILFDGTNLDKWTGNTVGYLPINGNIYVTANYGNESNLYTKKEYRDFIFRFEFCFVRPGVNNGVGIRTPMGVDAAYYGMCESQILDHDDPIYADLQDYQVHGSVYGVIPAKRIKHKPLGEWSQEEIRVQGDHITVIVNGETIVDGNIREACQGHNVAPDGGDVNPYTVDRKNHPGMFNEKGHIGFLGHGAGIKFRNVRILDLSKGNTQKAGARRSK